MSFNEHMFDLTQEWAIETGAEVIDIDAAAEWALANDKYDRLPISKKQQCMADMRRALQQTKHTDPQGNKVRTMHAVRNFKGEQMEFPSTIWIDVRTAKPDLVQEALKQEWDGIVNDVKRHAIEKRSYDLNNLYQATLFPFDYDFSAHAKDAELSGIYDDSYDDDFDDELD
jgi:hypothetical protein